MTVEHFGAEAFLAVVPFFVYANVNNIKYSIIFPDKIMKNGLETHNFYVPSKVRWTGNR